MRPTAWLPSAPSAADELNHIAFQNAELILRLRILRLRCDVWSRCSRWVPLAQLALCQAQAIDQTQARDADEQGQFSPAILALHARVRENIPKLGNDRSMSQDIQLVASMLSHQEPSGEMEIYFF